MYNFYNDGAKLVSTNYFESEPAKQGECYLTWNKSVGRLLVPQTFSQLIGEIKRTKIVEIEYIQDGLQLFFIDNNPDFPYMLQLAKEQTDRYDTTKGETKIAVYTEQGLQFEFDAEVV